MDVRLQVYEQSNISQSVYGKVRAIGIELLEYLNTPQNRKKLREANQPGNNSKLVQDVFLNKAIELGFISEKKGLFTNINNSQLRPDYYCRIGDSGIIIEVERGKTIMNNMDMLDMWKCHLCTSANHLFLFVPNNLKHNSRLKGYDCFKTVCDRMEFFYKRSNYNNVHSLWVYGY